MNSVKNARNRMREFPKAFSECTAEALAYGKCIATKDNLKKNDCLKEFEDLRKCAMTAMKKCKSIV